MGNKVPWKIGMLIYLSVTSRPLISPQKEAVLSPCNFATTHLTACILNFCLGARLRGRTVTQRSKKGSEKVLGRALGKGFSEAF